MLIAGLGCSVLLAVLLAYIVLANIHVRIHRKACRGEHVWKNCYCRLCDATRDEQHAWGGGNDENCECHACEKLEPHVWGTDGCTRCGWPRETSA